MSCDDARDTYTWENCIQDVALRTTFTMHQVSTLVSRISNPDSIRTFLGNGVRSPHRELIHPADAAHLLCDLFKPAIGRGTLDDQAEALAELILTGHHHIAGQARLGGGAS